VERPQGLAPLRSRRFATFAPLRQALRCGVAHLRVEVLSPVGGPIFDEEVGSI
jgi:hypothetical protein